MPKRSRYSFAELLLSQPLIQFTEPSLHPSLTLTPPPSSQNQTHHAPASTSLDVPKECGICGQVIERRDGPSVMPHWPCVATMEVHRLVWRDRHDGHFRQSGVWSGMT